MKFYLIIIAVMTASLQSYAQKNKGFTISGNIKGLKKDIAVHLSHTNSKGRLDTVCKTFSKNGIFTLKGNVPLPASFYFLQIDTSVSKSSKSLFLDNSEINITGSVSDWPKNLKTSGSPSHTEFEHFVNIDSALARKQREADNNYYSPLLRFQAQKKQSKMNATDSANFELKLKGLKKELKTVSESRYELWKSYIKQNPNSLYTPLLINRLEQVIGLDTMKQYYSELTNRAKESHEGIELKKQIESSEIALKIKIGDNAPDFKAVREDGEKVSLNHLISKNKITLLDFWASWCHPCRDEFKEHTKKTYDKYRSKGFDIVAISNDQSKDAWIQAVKNDQLNWINIKDLEEVGRISKNYGIYKLPSNFLLDAKGKILAIDLMGEELDNKLNELLK
jgi:peroxiredoxin